MARQSNHCVPYFAATVRQGAAVEVRALTAQAVASLCSLQQESGRWIDFSIRGESDQWVTAFAGLALASCELSSQEVKVALDKARDFLLAVRHPSGGWGYNALVQPDADSTCIAARFFLRSGYAVPQGVIGFLKHHGNPKLGYRTYLREDVNDRWGKPVMEMTAAAALTLFDAGVLSAAELREVYAAHVAWRQRENGEWRGFWWTTNGYPTLSACEMVARGDWKLQHEIKADLSTKEPFDLACLVHAYALLSQREEATAALQRLLSGILLPNGELCVRPSAYLQAPAATPDAVDAYAVDNHGVFTLAQIVRALAAYQEAFTDEKSVFPYPESNHLPRAESPVCFSGVADEAARRRALIVAADALAMTKDPLRSSLADGIPIEFSVRLNAAPLALRFACECGDARLAAVPRYRSQQKSLSRIAGTLGVQATWEKMEPLLRSFESAVPYVSDPRFLAWAGLDSVLDKADDFTLKCYLNGKLLESIGGNARSRSGELLQKLGHYGLCAAPPEAEVNALLEPLEAQGFMQEFGIGVQGDGRYGFKLYWEFAGWNDAALLHLVNYFNLEKYKESVLPFYHKGNVLITRSEAENLPFGLAVRLHPQKGFIPEVTVAWKLPVRSKTASDFAARLENFCAARQGRMQAFDDFTARFGQVGVTPSLITTTINAKGITDTVYVRTTTNGGMERCRLI